MLTPSAETAADVARIGGVDPARVRVVPWGAPEPAAPEGGPLEGPLRPLLGRDRAAQERRDVVEAIARAAPGTPW